MTPEALKKYISSTLDFPIKGVMFRDVTPLLGDYFPETIKSMANLFTEEEISSVDAFAGIDARGFIFAAALAVHFNKNFRMVRKSGKIPPLFSEVSYSTEYSECSIQMAHGKGRLVVIDDVLATGGTMTAAADLCMKAGYEVAMLATLIDLPFIHNASYQWNGQKVRSLISYKTPK